MQRLQPPFRWGLNVPLPFSPSLLSLRVHILYKLDLHFKSAFLSDKQSFLHCIFKVIFKVVKCILVKKCLELQWVTSASVLCTQNNVMGNTFTVSGLYFWWPDTVEIWEQERASCPPKYFYKMSNNNINNLLYWENMLWWVYCNWYWGSSCDTGVKDPGKSPEPK